MWWKNCGSFDPLNLPKNCNHCFGFWFRAALAPVIRADPSSFLGGGLSVFLVGFKCWGFCTREHVGLLRQPSQSGVRVGLMDIPEEKVTSGSSVGWKSADHGKLEIIMLLNDRRKKPSHLLFTVGASMIYRGINYPKSWMSEAPLLFCIPVWVVRIEIWFIYCVRFSV